MPGQITVSNACFTGGDLCEINIGLTRKQEAKLEGETCKSTEGGYQCGKIFLPHKYLPGNRRGTLTLFNNGKKVEKTILLPAATESEICNLQQSVFDKAVQEVRSLYSSKLEYYGRTFVVPDIISAMVRSKLFKQAEAMIPEIYYDTKKVIGDSQLGVARVNARTIDAYTELAAATGNTAFYDKMGQGLEKLRNLTKIAVSQRDKALFDHVIKEIPTISDLYNREQISNTIAASLIEIGFTDQALDFIGSNNTALSDVSKVDLLLKLKLLDEAVKLAQSISEPSEKIKALYMVAKIKADVTLFEQAVQLGLTHFNADPDRDKALLDLIEAMAEAGFYEPAMITVKEVNSDVYKAWALSIIAKEKKDKKLFEKVVKMGEKFNPKDKANFWGETSLNMARAGFFEEALRLANKISDKVEAKEEYLSFSEDRRSPAVSNIVIEMIKKHAGQKGIEIAKSLIRKGKMEDHVNIHLIIALADAGYFNQAVEIAKISPQNNFYIRNAVGIVAVKMAEAKFYNQAVDLAGSISEPLIKAPALAKIAGEMCAIP